MLAALGILDDAAGRQQLLALLAEGTTAPEVARHVGEYGTTQTTEVLREGVKLQITYFYLDSHRHTVPTVVSIIPKVLRSSAMGHATISRMLEPPPPDAVVLPASDTPTAYWHLSYRDPAQPRWDTYIAVNQTAIAPVVFDNAPHCVFVGVEQGVFALAAPTGTVVSAIVDTSYVQWIEQALQGGGVSPRRRRVTGVCSRGHAAVAQNVSRHH